MYKLGVVVGKFAPLTTGHINLITEAALQCERVIVVVSHDDRWLERQSPRDQKRLAMMNRVRWLQQTYCDMPHVDIAYINEGDFDIPEFPNGWEKYCSVLEDSILQYAQEREIQFDPITRGQIALFSSEVDYDEKYKQYLSTSITHVVVDAERTGVPISATKIRESLYDNWEYLPSVVRRDYTLRVVVMGTESTGKTTLVKNLAKLFNTSWVEEYGRVYCETVLCNSELTLRSDDYPLIAYRHKELEEQAMRTANRVCIIDTNAFITEFYHRLYEHKPNAIVSAIAHAEHFDLAIILDTNVPWVDDGLRVNSDRSKTQDLFDQMSVEFGYCPFTEGGSSPAANIVWIKNNGYGTRFRLAEKEVRKLLANFNNGDVK